MKVDTVTSSGAIGPKPPAATTDRLAGFLRRPLVRVVGRRLVMAVPLLFAVSVLTFILVALAPGDATQAILGAEASPDAYARLRAELGLDLPLYQQYWEWLKDAIHGDLGMSLFSGESVTHAISNRLPVTVALMAGSLLVSLVIGVSLGVLSAVRGGRLARTVDAFALIGFAVPAFWLGAELIVLFAVKLSWFPATGYVPFAQSSAGWLQSLTLPVIALAFGGIAALAKQTREAMLDTLSSEYITMAWANGVPARSVILHHALKNASIRVVTILGLQAVSLLGGTVVVENVFALPGLGSLAASATSRNDIPVIQGIVLYYTVMVIVVNLVIDIAYSWLNPRVGTT